MKLRYSHKQEEANDIWSYFFVPLEPATWIAGQSIRLELPRKTYGVSERRFTIASAPSEGYMQFTTRLGGSRFKQLLDGLKSDEIIQAHNIDGDFTWDEAAKHRIFVAGGIGITPYRAMLADQGYQSKASHTTLLFGSREDPAVFQEELNNWQVKDKTLRLIYMYEKRIHVDDILGIDGWQDSRIYLSGPSAMVEALHQELLVAGIDPKQLKADLFTGNLSS